MFVHVPDYRLIGKPHCPAGLSFWAGQPVSLHEVMLYLDKFIRRDFHKLCNLPVESVGIDEIGNHRKLVYLAQIVAPQHPSDLVLSALQGGEVWNG